MIGASRSSVAPDAFRLDGLALAELLRRHDHVVRGAEVLGVLVHIQPATRERQLVVHHRGQLNAALGGTHLAKAIGASETTLALHLARATAQALVWS